MKKTLLAGGSRIEWTDFTVNFWWGCTEVSPACANCYAREWAKFAGRRLFGEKVGWGKGAARFERLEGARAQAMGIQARAVREGRRFRVFANSMSDWLDAEVPAAWLAHMLETIRLTPGLDWQLLTKRPEGWFERVSGAYHCLGEQHHELLKAGHTDARTLLHFPALEGWLSNWLGGHEAPENVWVGTTVEDEPRARERILAVLAIPAGVHFLSCEPLLGGFDYQQHHWNEWFGRPGAERRWVIAGGESGKGPNVRPMHPEWVAGLRDQCVAAGVAFHFKQWGEWYPWVEHCVGTSAKGKKFARLQDGDGRSFCLLKRIGKGASGREIGGREWNGFPAGAGEGGGREGGREGGTSNVQRSTSNIQRGRGSQ